MVALAILALDEVTIHEQIFHIMIYHSCSFVATGDAKEYNFRTTISGSRYVTVAGTRKNEFADAPLTEAKRGVKTESCHCP